MITQDEALRLCENLAMELRRRHSIMWRHDNYYRGKHPLAFASEQFSKYFGKRYTEFADNWVQVVADAPIERLNISGIRLAGQASGYDEDLWSLWQENDCDEQSDLAFLEAVITGRAFALVWGDQDDNPIITFEHPTQCIVAYDMETRKRRAGLKLWTDDDYAYATLYTPDQVWKFQERQSEPFWEREFAGPYYQPQWEPRALAKGELNPIPNPLGVVPLVELQNRPRLIAEPMSDVAGAIAMQDAINLLWSYLFNAADFASLGQRVVTGAERPMVPILDDKGNPVGERPVDLEKFAIDRIIWLEDPDAKTFQWNAAALEPFTNVIVQSVRHLAAQSRTPTHYFEQMANLAADALKGAEVGLVKRTEEKTVNFGKGVKEIFRLAALVQGNEAKAKAVAGGKTLWRDFENRSEAQTVDALLKLKQIGFPFEYLAERLGLSPMEIERVQELRKEEAENDPLAVLAANDVQMTAQVQEGANGEPTPAGPPASSPAPADNPGSAKGGTSRVAGNRAR